MSSIVIAGYALFCIIVFFLVNRLLRKKKTKMGEEQVPAVSKIEISKVETEEKEIERKQESEISNVVELETGKQEEVKQEKEVPKKQMSTPVENVNVKAVVAVLILGMFVSILNQTIINVGCRFKIIIYNYKR